MNSFLITILTAFVTSFVTAATTYLLYWPKVKADLKREYASRFNEKKWDVYSDFADVLRQLFAGVRDGNVEDEQPQLIDDLHRFASALWLVGSDEVFDAFNQWLRKARALADADQAPFDVFIKLSSVIVEMRKDLGYESTEITARDLLTPFITDVDQYIEQ